MKMKLGIVIRLSALAVLVACASGCASYLMYFKDRKRALIYLPPENFHSYSAALAKELAYSEQWALPLEGTVNVDVSSISYRIPSDDSLLVSLHQKTLEGRKRVHFLVTGTSSRKPSSARAELEGDIVPVSGRLYAIEKKESGFVLSSCSGSLTLSDRKNITLSKFVRRENNELDSTNSGYYRVEDNLSSYFISYPFIVFFSVNYKTDKYYKHTRYQSEEVRYNSIEFYIVNLETGATVETREADFTPYYKRNISGTMGGVFGSVSAITIVDDGRYVAFSLTDGDSYVNGYFENDSGKTNDIVFDSAKNIVALFPTLVVEKSAEKTKEELILERAVNNETSISLADGDAVVLGYAAIPGAGFLVFGRPLGKNAAASVLYFTDEKLEKTRWKRDFKGLTVRRAGAVEGLITLPDLDQSGNGLIIAKDIGTGEETRLLPANLYQSDTGVLIQYCAAGNGVLVLYDDARGALIGLTR